VSVEQVSILGLCFGMVLALRQISMNSATAKWNRLNRTLDYSLVTNSELAATRRVIHASSLGRLPETSVRDFPPIAPEALSGLTEDDDRAIRTLLAHLQGLAVACRHDVADERVARELLGTTVMKYWQWLGPYVDQYRLGPNPEYLRELQLMVEDWIEAEKRRV